MKKYSGISSYYPCFFQSYLQTNIIKFSVKICLAVILSIIFSFKAVFGQTNSAAKHDYYKVSEVRIFINNNSDIYKLKRGGVLIDNVKLYNNYLDVMLDSTQINILKISGYTYKIKIDDVTKDYLERLKNSNWKTKLKKPVKSSGFEYGSMGGFLTFDEVAAQLDKMRSLYPNLITKKDSIGSSIEGRPIWAVKISNNADMNSNKPQIFYNSLIHAREPEGMMVLIYYMYYLLENYGHDPEVTYLLNNRELYFIPVINPDGYVYNEQISPEGGGLWRKNRRSDSSGVFGVDLNRNFGYMWGYDNMGSSSNSIAEDYRGKAPFSEPEAQALRDFCINHNFKIGINYHTYGGYIIPPWGYDLLATPDSNTFNNIVSLASSLNDYNGDFNFYTQTGCVRDWMYGERSLKNKIYGISIEAGTSFWPMPDEIIPAAQENLYSNLVYAWGPGVIENPPFISSASLNKTYLHPLTDTLKFEAVESNPDNYTSNVYAQILAQNDSLIDEFKPEKTDTSYYGSWQFNLDEESFYKLKLVQNGMDIPSNFYRTFKFTSAGPLTVDSVSSYTFIVKGKCYIKPFIHNNGKITTLKNVYLRFIDKDSIITSYYPIDLIFPEIKPGSTTAASASVASNSFLVTYDPSRFKGYFNLKFEMSVDGMTYWVDSTKSIIAGTNFNDQEPVVFNLLQNYPNPFNPTTNLSFVIGHRSLVSLKVYDVLGREVATLVNEEKPAGTYEVEFNGSDLPSGVYFYRLTSENFVQTKKAVLLK